LPWWVTKRGGEDERVRSGWQGEKEDEVVREA